MSAAIKVVTNFHVETVPRSSKYNADAYCASLAMLSNSRRGQNGRFVLKTRIFVVEDHAAVRQAIVESLNREPDVAVCGEAEDVSSALTAIAAGTVDLVLADIQLGASNGIELIRELRRLYPTLRLVAMTMFDPVRYESEARAAGASGFAIKQEGPQRLIETIRAVLETKL